MFQFSLAQPHNEIAFFTGVFNDIQGLKQHASTENQRALDNLKTQTQNLISQVSSLKETFGSFALQVKQSLAQMSQHILAIKKATQTQRPRKKFKKVFECVQEDCDKKYSSKIALNCHLRNKHSLKQ